ncbi:MAG: diacylglycerol kinase family protein [Clostridia bacterium]|nr:diacylglycerol kinase family protein [Clostridia bacterium]
MKYYFLFNPLAGKGRAEHFALELDRENPDATKCYDMTKIDSFAEFLTKLSAEDALVICGGDGTLNGFINKTANLEIKNDILYFPAGSGNDFMKDLNRVQEDKEFRINDYIKNLPVVTIKGRDYRFINGVGFGIDGVVCAEGDRLRSKGKKVDYTTLAVKCLARFKPVNATVTIDGVEKKYQNVWMTTTMKGRFFGGGMMVAPDQKRDDKDGKISVLVAHSLSRLRILTLFPSIFKGKHIKYTKYIDLLKCDSISVEYDTPCALQMDGEPMLEITGYSATIKSKEKVLV